ncbi:MAG: SDR family NAD(P)-dependent oxidoreductase [bacterium]|nr:SDR family NAD(P)-dependent oxidoreductase [bacterium]
MNADYMNYFDFKECTALVAGGGSGLGLEITKGLLAYGCKVAIFGRDEERIQSVASEFSQKSDGRCAGFVADIADEQSVQELTRKVTEYLGGKVNIAINSAGFNIRNPIENVSLAEWHKVLATNLTGGFLFARAMLPLLKTAEFGRLINVVSIFGSHSFRDRVSYASSKGGLLQLTRTLAIEWASHSITVNSISPGPFLTDINKAILNNPEAHAEFCRNIPLGRFGNPSEVVTAALFLASPHSSFVTGADIIVDGGWTVT